VNWELWCQWGIMGLGGVRVRGLGGIVRCILVIKIVLRVFGSYRYLREEE